MKQLNARTSQLCRAAVLASLNRQTQLRDSFAEALDSHCSWHDLYETSLQVYLFAGFPAAIEALQSLETAVQGLGRDSPNFAAAALDPDAFEQQGERLCRSIYSSAYDKMRRRFGRIAPDLDLWMIVEGYGKTLARPGLDIKTRELITVAILAALGWSNQLFSHIRGAMNCGADLMECTAVLDLVAPYVAEEHLNSARTVLNNVANRSSG